MTNVQFGSSSIQPPGYENVLIGGNGTITGNVQANVNATFLPGVSFNFGAQFCVSRVSACWPGYPSKPKLGDLSFSQSLSLNGSSIVALFESSSMSEYVPRVSPGFSSGMVFAEMLQIKAATIYGFFNVTSSHPVLKWGTVS